MDDELVTQERALGWTLGELRAQLADALDDMHRRALCQRALAHPDVALREHAQTLLARLRLDIDLHGSRGGDLFVSIPAYDITLHEDTAYGQGQGTLSWERGPQRRQAPLDFSLSQGAHQPDFAATEPLWAALDMLATTQSDRWEETLRGHLRALQLVDWGADTRRAGAEMGASAALLHEIHRRAQPIPMLRDAWPYELGDLFEDASWCVNPIADARGALDFVWLAAAKAVAMELLARQAAREREVEGLPAY
jgi:hypothetical protein